ncbi:MAG: N-acyl amino acid synthase FeeM domain-containing protein [Rhodoblastus sp.]
MNAHQRVPTFNEKVAEVLKTVTYRVARTEQDREAIFGLRYRGYLLDGGIGPNERERFQDPWDDVDNAVIMGMYFGDRLASTVRFHTNNSSRARIPAMDTFGDVLEPYLGAGKLIVDPTRFVIEPEFARMGPDLPFLTLRMIAMAAEYFGAAYVLATVRAEHVVMYRRVNGHRPISEPRAYPMLARKIVCTIADIDTLRATAYGRHPFLQSTAEERAGIFANDAC